ncbi:hypothetical protein Dimus_026224 [Dionaea muscipula]
MENGAVVAAEPHLEEVKAAKGGFSTAEVEEKVFIGGLHRPNPSDGDDVFEEAIDVGFLDDAVNSDCSDDVAVGDSVRVSGLGKSSDDVGHVENSGVWSVDEITGDSRARFIGDEHESVEVEEALHCGKTIDEASMADKGGTVSCEDGGLTRIESKDLELLEDAGIEAPLDDGKGAVEEGGGVEDDGSGRVDSKGAVEGAPAEEPESAANSEYLDDGEIVVSKDSSHPHEDNGLVYVDSNIPRTTAPMQLEDALAVISSCDQSDMVEELKETLAGDRSDVEVLCRTSIAGKPCLDDDENIPGCQDENFLDDYSIGAICQKIEDASVASFEDQTDNGGELEKALVSLGKAAEAVGESEESGMDLGSVGPDLHDQVPKLEESASSVNPPVDNGKFTSELQTLSQDYAMPKNAECETATSDSRKENASTCHHQSSSEDADDIRDYHMIEEQVRDREIVHEKRQTIQSIGEVGVSTPPSTDPSSAKSATPVLPVRGVPPLEAAPRVAQQSRSNVSASQVQAQLVEEAADGEAEEGDETREKLQMIRVKFLRLAHRLGQTPHNVVVAQVLYRLGLAEQLRGRNGGRVGAFTFDRASAMAEQLEATGQEPLDFSCTIMVLGKTGVGKSATINSIFDEVKFATNAFQVGTKRVQDVVGTVQGIKVKIIDTPGLLSSWSDQHQNMKILHSVKRFIQKTPPDIVLYLDRLDAQSRDLGDMPLLRTITEVFGPSIWFNAIVVLTHAASAPPEGPNGTTSTYDMFVTQRSHAVQQAIRQAAGDIRLMNPVSLVENHSACRTNRAGQRVLPNGQVWKPHLLLLSFASKILAEANELLKLQDGPPGKPLATRSRTLPLPVLLSSLLQSRPQLKLPEEQFDDDDDDLDDLDDSSDDESTYEKLPPFRRLTNTEVAKLSKDEKNAYYDELEYREKLFMKKQLKDEKKRRRTMKEMAESGKDFPADYNGENVAEENGGTASVPVPVPDLALPASFDSDNPTHRYRCLDNSNPWLVRPVVEPTGWDHDVGYEGINVERLFAIRDKIPLSFSGQVSKDKKDINLQVEVASSIKHGEGKSTMLGLDMQSAGKDMVYTLRSETRFHNHLRNKATAGISVTVLGDLLTAGMKIEDKLIVNKRLRLVMSGGALTGRGDVAYGGSLEATLRDKDHPLGRSLTSLGLSVMDWHGELATGFNLQSQIPIGRSTNLTGRVNLNNKGSGQVSIRLNSSEQLQLVLVGLIPLIRKLIAPHEQY